MSPQQISNIKNPLVQQALQKKSRSQSQDPAGSFGSLLQTEQLKHQDLKVSAHAQKRLDQGNINLTPDHQERIQQAMSKMEEKGADKSLVLMDGMALVVSVKNRTIITAVEGGRTKDGVFTNIDSAIII